MTKLRVGLITTVDTNIGDDFIRQGICLLLGKAFKSVALDYVIVNKHEPISVYPRWHPIHLAVNDSGSRKSSSYFSRVWAGLALQLTRNRFDGCDLIVQCGAPVAWPDCHKCEWAGPLWYRVVIRLSSRIPVLNLAAGSCYPWERQPTQIAIPQDDQFLRAILGCCHITTVRDRLAETLFGSLGFQTPLIPCAAFVTGESYPVNTRSGSVVLINYMHNGGHYDFGQPIDANLWMATIRNLVGRVRRRHKVAFLCHDAAEYALADVLDATVPRLWPKNSADYAALVSDAKVVLANRMHASVFLGGLGIPSVTVGTDTRMLMLEPLGLPFHYVSDTHVEQLESELECLLGQRSQETERLLTLRSQVCERYLETMEACLGSQ